MRQVVIPRTGEQGTAFVVVMFLVVMSSALVGAYFAASLGKVRHVEQEEAESSAFNAAESGLNAAVEALWAIYRDADPANRVESLRGMDGSGDPDDRFVIANTRLGTSFYSVRVNEVRIVPEEYADVEIASVGGNRYARRTLIAVIRYGHEPSAVFDHAYFINNFGWLWGAGVTVNGSVRSNGNFSLKNPVVNGDIYASSNAELGADGTIDGDVRTKDIDWYNGYYSDRARPTDPSAPPEDLNGNGIMDPGEDVNGNGVLDTYEFPDGYDSTPEWHPHLPKVDMPYLGDLSIYSDLAVEKGGTISHGGTVVVDAVLGDDAAEGENLVLVGTVDDPIVLNGPVVVKNDVVLKGYITGQGTIYAGRNVHVIGDLTYQNPPSWPKPMTDPDAVAAANATKDLVGLAAKGSIILGDYTGAEWSAVTRRYQTPPFVQEYKVHPSDAANGYASYYDAEGNPVFDGNYRGNDGGFKATLAGGKKPRKFFESSLPDEVITSLADAQVKHIDAVLYTNHLLSGKVGAAVFNGTLVSRNEAIIYDGSLEINYDLRTSSGSYEFLDSYLPRQPSHHFVYWAEGR